ncbi:PadR family transcriptional regulator [Dyella sp. SG609]|uniref:helix-turn-helix transcriptional regulator n=1 Tax=Dyella sp. SG609 TaxID=2587018 RepID=UPI001793DAB5|nr:DNA-binding PadR family transcriptional regulator [Dyella sp. SG609]
MSSRKVSNPLALAVMAWLLTGPMHPYELGKRLKDTGKDRNIKYNRGSLYMVVEQLLKAGYIVEHETLRDTSRPERTVYALTTLGRHELYAWMREWTATPQHEYPQFGVALSLLSVMEPSEAVELLLQRQTAMQAQIETIESMFDQARRDNVPWIFLIEEDYRLVLLKAEYGFISELAESLNRADYLETWQTWKASLGQGQDP